MDKTIRLVVLEDHKVIGTSLAVALSELPDIDVVGVATSLREVRELIRRTQPDIVLADADLGDEWSLELPLELGRSGPRVLFLSRHVRPAVVATAVGSGAAGFIHKDEPFEEVVAGIRAVAAGRTAFALGVLAVAGQGPHGPSPREREVLALVVRGAANKEIGAALGIEDRTVETHIRRLFDRYGISNRVELAVLALREGWVDVGI